MIKAKRKLKWWTSAARGQIYATMLLSNNGKYRKATGGYRMDTRREIDVVKNSESISIEIEKDKCKFGKGWLSTRRIQVTYSQIKDGDFLQICQQYWNQEAVELAEWEAY